MAHVKEISAKVSKIVNEFDLLLALKVQSLFIAGERGGGRSKGVWFYYDKIYPTPSPIRLSYILLSSVTSRYLGVNFLWSPLHTLLVTTVLSPLPLNTMLSLLKSLNSPPPNFSGDGGWLIPYPRIIQSKAKLRSMRSTTWERGGWGMGCTCVNFCRVPIIFNTIRSWKCDPIQCHIPIKLSLRSTPPHSPAPQSNDKTSGNQKLTRHIF